MLKSKKGFTLVELMIVIAIIGILALVLIPQAGKMRDNARESGVDANSRIAAAQAEGLIDLNGTVADFAAALDSKIGTSLQNPFDRTKTDVTSTDALADDGTAPQQSVVIYTPATAYNAVDNTSADAAADIANYYIGTVVVVPFEASATDTSLKGAWVFCTNKDKSVKPNVYTVEK